MSPAGARLAAAAALRIASYVVERAHGESVVLRLGRHEDRAFIVQLATETFADLGDYRATVVAWLDAADAAAIVAVEGEAQLGFALLAARRAIGFARRAAAELLAIALAPGARGQGIGRMLLERAELVARGWDADEMYLHTAESNLRAQRFFHAAGYRPREVGASAYPSGEVALAFGRVLG